MLIRTVDGAADCLRAVAAAEVVAIDTETTGLHPYSGDYVTGVSVATDTGAWYWPVAHVPSGVPNRDPRPLLRLLRDKRQIWHHAKFDWAMLYEGWRWTPSPDSWDTQVAAWLMDENLPTGLKERAAFLWGEDSRAEKVALQRLLRSPKAGGQGKTYATLTAEDMGAYAAKDAELTLRLYRHFEDTTPRAVWEHEMAVQRVLYDLTRRGIGIDTERAETLLAEAEAEIADIEEGVGINLRSTVQVARLVYDEWGLPCYVETPTGDRSTSVAVLSAHEGDSRVARILRHRQLSKAVSAYYRPLLSRVGLDGRVHPSFSSTRTVTGRLSCSDPNLQTIPREDTLSGVREVFRPADGAELWEYDLKAAELRVMASWAGETHIVEALEQGRDLHSETAARIFGPNYTSLQRRVAKGLNFGASYGIGPAKLASTLHSPVRPKDIAEARKILDSYFETYPRVSAMMRGLEKIARRDGVIPLHKPGRYRRFRSPGRQADYYTALNAVVQGGVGEFMKDVMLEAADLPDGDMLLQVHDSLVVEVEPGAGPKVHQRLQQIADDINPFKMRMEWEAKQWTTP